MKYNRNCENCGTEFLADSREINRGNAKYCSLSCAAQNQRKNAIMHQVICQGCGNTFNSKNKDAKYCCAACKLVVYRRKQKSQEGSIKTFQRILGHLPCEICGWKETTRDLHHIIPVSQGGKNTIDNLISLCPNHHRMVHKNLISQEALNNALKLRLSLHPEINQEQDAISGN